MATSDKVTEPAQCSRCNDSGLHFEERSDAVLKDKPWTVVYLCECGAGKEKGLRNPHLKTKFRQTAIQPVKIAPIKPVAVQPKLDEEDDFPW